MCIHAAAAPLSVSAQCDTENNSTYKQLQENSATLTIVTAAGGDCRWIKAVDCPSCAVSPGGQVEASLEAAEDVNLSLGPDVLDAGLDPVDHPGPHVVLLGGRHHPLEEVLYLLMQPGI